MKKLYKGRKKLKKIKENIMRMENEIKSKLLKENTLKILFFVVIVILAIASRYAMLDYKSPDYNNFLEKWFYQIKDLGGFSALKYNIGDYNVPYLTILAALTYIPKVSPLILIKAVSIFFDFVGAIYAAKLCKAYLGDENNKSIKPLIVFTIIMFLPTVLINSALWAQCDIIYVTFILMSLYYLKKNHITISFICLGISFAFKLQFIFILPIYILLYLQKKDISIFHFTLIPIVNLILCIPSLIIGKSLKDCIMIYFNQTETYTALTLNYPNLYNIFIEFFKGQTLNAIIFTVVVVGIIAFYILYKKINVEENILRLSLLFSVLMVFFLPRMHERYAFLTEVLSIIYVVKYKKDYYFPIVLQLATLSAYFNFLAQGTFNSNIFILFSIVEFVAIVKFTIDTFKDNKQIEVKSI